MEEMYMYQYKMNKDFDLVEHEDYFIYINYDQALWLKTDLTGKKIIDKCEGTKNLDEIFSDLSAEKGIDAEILKVSCHDFVQQIILERVIFNIDIPDDKVYPIFEENQKYPSSIWIHLTSECNLFCPFCYSSSGGNKKYTLVPNDIINFLSGIPEDNRNDIILSGGEPLLYADLINLVKAVKEELKFNKITIITNGTTGSEKYSELSKYIDIIQFSVDSPDRSIFELTRGKGNYDRIIANIALAKDVGIKDRVVSFTPTVINIDTLKDLPSFCFENSINGIHISKYMPVGRGQTSIKSLKADPQKFTEEFTAFYDNYNKVNSDIRIKKNLYEVNIPEDKRTKMITLSYADNINNKVFSYGRRYSCGLGSGIISINYDGNIYLCPSLHHEEFKTGTIYESVDEVMNKGKEIVDNLNVESEKSECNSCKYKYFCGGGCKAVSYAEKDIFSMNSECETEKLKIDYAIMNTIIRR